MRTLICLALAAILGFGRSAHASLIVAADVSEVTLASVADSVEVDYVVVTVPVPALPPQATVTLAYLEFFLDASSMLESEAFDGFVTLEVFPYPSLRDGKLDPGELAAPAAKCAVRIGSDQPVRAYVTSALVKAIAESKSEFELLVGSITGARTARFDARTVPGAPNGAKAVLNVLLSQEDNPRGD